MINFQVDLFVIVGQKNQSLNSFYQAEIMNNYALAFKLTNITTIADEKLMKMHQNM
jgi:hypothetical protein